jgi:hypothetical protein
MGSGFTLVYSLSALLAAAAVLHYTWREGPETLARQGWRERWRRRARGGEGYRRWLRRRWMTRNPFCWLAARDRGMVLLAEAFLGLAVLLWLAGWAAMGARWLSLNHALACAMVLHLCFNWILAYAAGKRLAEERQSGGFEVLLTVPLEPKTIVDGQCRALLTQFRTVWMSLFLLDGLLCASAPAGLGGLYGLLVCRAPGSRVTGDVDQHLDRATCLQRAQIQQREPGVAYPFALVLARSHPALIGGACY